MDRTWIIYLTVLLQIVYSEDLTTAPPIEAPKTQELVVLSSAESNASSVLEDVPSERGSIIEVLSEEALNVSTGRENDANQEGSSLAKQLGGAESLESASADEKEIHDFLVMIDSTEQNQTAAEGIDGVIGDSEKYFNLSELFKWHYNYQDYDTSNETLEVDDVASDEILAFPSIEGKLVKFVDEDNVSANDTGAVVQLTLGAITEEPVIERTSITTGSDVDPLVTNLTSNGSKVSPFIETTTTIPFFEATVPSTIDTPSTEDVEFTTTTPSWYNTTSTVDVEATTTPITTTTIATTTEAALIPGINLSKYLQENPYATEISSENYPSPYPDNYNQTWSMKVSNGAGIEVVVHDLSIDPATDSLLIRGGSVHDVDYPSNILTGEMLTNNTIIIPHTTELYVQFISFNNTKNKNRGFTLTFAPYGIAITTTPDPTPEPTVPTEVLQSIRRELTMRAELQNDTANWDRIRSYLTLATNNYIRDYNMSFYDCRTEDVVFLTVQKCPETWPKSDECVTVEFAIPLRPIVVVTEDNLQFGRAFIDLPLADDSEPEYELSIENLEKMWVEYAVVVLSENGIEVYLMPESGHVLAIWITISLCIIAAFIFVLYSIWKIDFFKDYRRMSAQPEDKTHIYSKDSDYDISMFPSPHQDVPKFFPNGNDVEGGIDNVAAQYDAIFSRYDPPDFEKIYDHTLMYDNNNRSGKNQFNSYSRMPSEIMDFNGSQKASPFRVSATDSDKTMYVKGTNHDESMS